MTDIKPVALAPSSVAAFTEAMRGPKGTLDAWLEVNNEAEVRAHVEAYAEQAIDSLRAEVERLVDLVNGMRSTIERQWGGMDSWRERAERAEAEVEALRVDVEAWKASHSLLTDTCHHFQARTERLAEALREIERLMPDQAGPAWIAKTIASAALHDHDQEGKDG